VTPAGAVLDGTRITIGPGAAPCQPSVASDGTNWLVVWTSLYGSVNGARVSGSGMVLDSPGFLIEGGLPSWPAGPTTSRRRRGTAASTGSRGRRASSRTTRA